MLPYIALLMCLLGSLLLITMSMASINIGAGAGEGWISPLGSSDTKKTPLLVEWDGEKVSIQDPKGLKQISLGRETRTWWNSNGDFKSREMLDFLEEMARQREGSYVLFAVRPSGFGNFQVMAHEFRTKKVDIGYEPIEQGKAVRLLRSSEAKP